MNEKRRWFKNPFVIAVLVVLVVLAPFLAVKTYYVADRYINEPVVNIDNPTLYKSTEYSPAIYSREDVLEAVEVVKAGFYSEFPYSSIETIIAYGSSTEDHLVFEIQFRPGFFEKNKELIATGDDGIASLWFSCDKTEKGKWEYTDYGSDG